MPTTSIFAPLDTFTRRHVGPQPASVQKMLEYLGYESMDAFLKDCVPQDIRLEENAIRDEGAGGIWALSEGELLRRAKEIGKKNKVTRSFIGLGYHQAVSQFSRFSSWLITTETEMVSFTCRFFPKLFFATCSRTTDGSVNIPPTRYAFLALLVRDSTMLSVRRFCSTGRDFARSP